MAENTRRGALQGIGFGLIAGLIFGIVEVVGAGMMGNPLLMPIRMFASVVLGQPALETTALGGVLVVGVVAHLALSALFGLIYGLVNSRLSRETQASFGRQLAIGLLFGTALWLVNFQIVARLLYPWFLTTPQLAQFVMHALFFGLPLGVMYASAERRSQPIRRVPTPA